MIGIIMEGALFVAVIATVAALLFYALLRWTPLGLRLRQDRNRRQIEHTLELECPIHGLQREEAMVRLPSGSRICPACYKEAVAIRQALQKWSATRRSRRSSAPRRRR